MIRDRSETTASPSIEPIADSTYAAESLRPTRYQVLLEPDVTAGDAARHVLSELRRTVAQNARGVANADPEFLHQVRVAVRGARALIGRLDLVLDPHATEALATELKWLASRTGPPRDMDVYEEALEDYRAALDPEAWVALAPLRSLLARRAIRERELVATELEASRFRNLLDTWDEVSVGAAPGPEHNEPARTVALGWIRRRFDHADHKARALSPASLPEGFHELRIDLKKLRYLVEFFGGLYASERVANLLPPLKRLQDHLGDMNDLAVQRGWIRPLARELVGRDGTDPDLLIALGELSAVLRARLVVRKARVGLPLKRFTSKANRTRVARLAKG